MTFETTTGSLVGHQISAHLLHCYQIIGYSILNRHQVSTVLEKSVQMHRPLVGA
jgi:hypothetical protein